MGVRNRARMLTSSNESGNVRHVDEQNGAHRISNLTQSWEIDNARVRRRAGSNHRRPNLLGLSLQRVVVDPLGLLAHAVLRDVVELTGEICWVTMGKMSAVREIHGQNLFAAFQH